MSDWFIGMINAYVKGFIIPLFCHFLVFYFLGYEIQPPSSENLIKLTEECTSDENITEVGAYSRLGAY